ncbi:MAG: hypothetical protein NZ992_02020 [Candidatus Korarchaeum sp.]|nr:hypothetical protein [Candidatus Korarchaeum sp.]MDW8035009.1 hypothetical protein [Candidatus Korarchaeum sp.]
MNSKMLAAVSLNVIFVVILLAWPLINSPKFSVSIEEDIVPLGGQLNFTLSFPSVPLEVRVEVIDPKVNRTLYSVSLNPSSEVRGSVRVEEGRFGIGFHVLRVHAILNGREVIEESYFSVYGAAPIYLELSVGKPTLVVEINQTESNYAQVSEKILAKVRTDEGPVEGVKLLAVSIGSNSTVTEVAKTDSEGEAVLEWRANVSSNSTYRVVVQAVKPGHPLASGEISIEVIVRRSD